MQFYATRKQFKTDLEREYQALDSDWSEMNVHNQAKAYA
ncbi:hypothetical protein [Pseudomonas sp. 8 R 14]|nr:hypothetical protein [Pseudomonas sp. 8 R 14]